MKIDYDEIIKTIGEETEMRIKLNTLCKISAQRGKKITQGQIGTAIGCGDAMISKWLKGERSFSLGLRMKMYAYIQQLEDELEVK